MLGRHGVRRRPVQQGEELDAIAEARAGVSGEPPADCAG